MSYTRPAHNAADATWQGASDYSAPDQLAVAASWLPEFVPLPASAADASWQGAGPYTVPTQTADASFEPVQEPPGPTIHDASIQASLPDPATEVSLALSASVTHSHGVSASASLPDPATEVAFSLSASVTLAHTASANAALPDPTTEVSLTTLVTTTVVWVAQASITLPDPRDALTFVPSIEAEEDLAYPDNTRGLRATPHHEQGLKSANGSNIESQNGLKAKASAYGQWKQMIEAPSPIIVETQEAIRFKREVDTDHTQMLKIDRRQGSPHAEAIRYKREHYIHEHERGVPLRGWSNFVYAECIRVRPPRFITESYRTQLIDKRNYVGQHQALKIDKRNFENWTQAIYPDPGRWWGHHHEPCYGLYATWKDDVPLQGAKGQDPYTVRIGHASASWKGLDTHQYVMPPWYRPPEEVLWIKDGIEITIPKHIKPSEVYIVLHTISVKRLSDNLDIDAANLNISIDADSWAWKFNANLLGEAALAAVKPSVLGEPVILEVTVNGTAWHMLVEDWTEARQFGQRSIQVVGRGLSAELSSPYELPTSGVQDQQYTLQQLMNTFLPLDASWTLSWTDGMADWTVPAGAYNWSNQTPIGAIHDIAQAVGMTIIPDTNSKVLYIKPRYPVLPWNFSVTPPDLLIPDSGIYSYQRQNSIPTQANGVYLHGQEVGGVFGIAKRNGTQGERTLPTYNNNLMTDAAAITFTGSRLLAGQHQQPEIRSVVTNFDGNQYPLASIGDLTRITLEGVNHYGIVNSVNLAVTPSSVRQTITFGETTNNQWAAFKQLIPQSPLLYASVISDHTDGTYTVSLPSGNTLRVRGDSGIAVAAKVWVRDSRIEGTAPTFGGTIEQFV